LSSPPKVIIIFLNITFGLKNVQLYYSLSLHIVIALLKYRQKYYLERAGVLDHNQETFVRQIQEGHRIIKGPSGCGKTIILVHKAAFLKKHNKQIRNILFVYYNITLGNYIRRLLSNKRVPLGENGVEVYSFFELCSKILDIEVKHENESSDYYEAIVELTLEELKKGKIKYDAILVDEGQDFSDDMYKSVKLLLNEATNNLTIGLDDNQNIYRREHSWAEVGINAVGRRTQKIKHVYRSTVEIINFVNKFLWNDNKSIECEKEKQIEMIPSLNEAHGPAPEIKQVPDINKLIFYITDKIYSISVSEGCPLYEFAIIYFSKYYGSPAMANLPDMLKGNLESKGILSNWVSKDYRSKKSYDITTNNVTISSIHSLKGFDYSCVFLVGFDFIENKIWTDDQIEKLVYVAITRARDRLFIPYINKTPLITRLLNSL